MAGKSFLFFSAAIVMVGVFFILGATSAYAYAVPSSGQPIGGQSTQPSTGVNTTYNFGDSFQNLVSPFQNFFNNLKWNSSATFQINPTSTMMPPVNITPSVQNIFTQFDDWFYGLTGFRLSGLVVVVLTGLSWVLGIAKGISDWLLGLFR